MNLPNPEDSEPLSDRGQARRPACRSWRLASHAGAEFLRHPQAARSQPSLIISSSVTCQALRLSGHLTPHSL